MDCHLVLYFTHLLIINKDGNVYIPITKYGRCLTTEWSVLIATVQQQTGRKLSDPYWSKYCVSFGSDFIRLRDTRPHSQLAGGAEGNPGSTCLALRTGLLGIRKDHRQAQKL